MRLRFTIRDLLWLTALAALAVGWWLDHRHASESYFELEQSASVTQLRAAEATYQATKLKFEQFRQKVALEKTQKASEKDGKNESNVVTGR